MKSVDALKDIIAEIYPLHRTLVSDGTDKALDIIGSYMPESVSYTVESYAPGSQVWTWQVPERYVVSEAYLETEDGQRIVDFEDNPLHLVSYSPPIDSVVTWEELEPHLYYSEKRPNAVPWKFTYYERSWGFCMSKERFDSLPRDKKYHAVIDVDFVADSDKGLRVGVAVVHPEGGPSPSAGEMIICAHVCHPMQANDDVSGVVTAIKIAHQLVENPLPPGSLSVRFLFCPETIGSISYFAHNEEIIPGLKGGVFIEMTGNRNMFNLQRTRQDNHLVDRIGRYVLKKHGQEFRERYFAEVVPNDERVINGPGLNVPCISIHRFPYDEYHTSDDNLDIIHEDMLQEAVEVIEEIIRIYATNYVPRRRFRGPVFLSGHGLWVDWQDNWDLNRAIEKIMMSFEGDRTVFDIAEGLELDYWDIYDYVERFRKKGLIDMLPLPQVGDDA